MKSKKNWESFRDHFNASRPEFGRLWEMELHLMSELEQACRWIAIHSKTNQYPESVASSERLMLRTIEKLDAWMAKIERTDDRLHESFKTGNHSKIEPVAKVLEGVARDDAKSVYAAVRDLMLADVDLNDRTPIRSFKP